MEPFGQHTYPHALSWMLDNSIRRIIQNPRRIFREYVRAGDTVLDYGCASGTFTIDLARMVGEKGKVVGADLQKEMLDKLAAKAAKLGLMQVETKKCGDDGIGLTDDVDFALAFYVMHEVPDQGRVLKEIASRLKPGGLLLIVEPVIHVSGKAFQATITMAEEAGLELVERPSILLSQAALLKRPGR